MKSEGMLEITTVIGCPIACKACPQDKLMSRYTSSPAAKRLSLDDFRHILSSVPTNVRISFAGMAEPWLNPHCTDMVLHAVERGHPVAIFTTLVGMKIEDFERIKHIAFEEFVVHVADSQNNARIPVTENAFRVLEAVVRTYCSNGRPAWFSVQSHGAPHPRVLELIRAAGYPRDFHLEAQLIDRAGNLSNKEVSALNVPQTEFVYGPIECRRCGTDTNHNVLLPDGRVLLCCMDYGMRHVLGNLLTDGYSEIQNGRAASAIREAWRSHDADLLCRHCCDARPRLGDTSFSFEAHLSEASLLEGDASQAAVWTVAIGSDVAERSIFLHPPARLRFEVPTSEEGLFTAAVALHPDVWDNPESGACEFSLIVNGHEAFSRVVDPSLFADERCWHDVSVPVPACARGHHEFILVTRTLDSRTSHRWALWRRPVFHWRLLDAHSAEQPETAASPAAAG
ncbi:MAG TPA: SPASM domain-containing protein [Verrucomicrobiae bacterium]|nr:SPASM domain-containing protein [Verrucomicrobiae bacterium]